MIVANTRVIVGDKTFQKGQVISGLSDLDKGWMLAAGYISERKDTVKGDSKGKQKPAGDSSVDTVFGNE